MKKYIPFVILILSLCAKSNFAQVLRDQDLITLKNGYQYLGFVIEQQPGKMIRIYRPLENDTVNVPLQDIEKLSKILVQNFSEKKVEPDDSIVIGRFNNKNHVFQFMLAYQLRDVEKHARRGFGISYLRSFRNVYQCGISATLFSRQNPGLVLADAEGHAQVQDFSLLQHQWLLENKIRLTSQPQHRRFTMLFALNAGYVGDMSRLNMEHTAVENDAEYERYRGGFMLQTGLDFKINPDNNSGFIIQPGYCFFPQHVELYSATKGTSDAAYLGFRRQVNHLFSLKFSYFF
jgi:hypothetical protein